MKKIFDNKRTLFLVPMISIFLFVTIVTASPTTIIGDINTKEIKTIATVSDVGAKSSVKSPTKVTTDTVPSPQPAKKTSTPVSPAKKTSTSASTSVKRAPQPSRSKSTPTPAKPVTRQTSSKAGAIIATGKKFIGVKYVYGGTTPSGFDCSGFTQYVFAKNGVSLPRVSRDQYKVGTAVSFSNLKQGDLVFFSLAKNGVIDHVGIYTGNGQFINASSSKGVTIYTLGTYWKSAFIGAKRVL